MKYEYKLGWGWCPMFLDLAIPNNPTKNRPNKLSEFPDFS